MIKDIKGVDMGMGFKDYFLRCYFFRRKFLKEVILKRELEEVI